jgi:hypothetical protein
MAGKFTVDGRTYPDTPAGHLLAAKDKANGALYLHGHRMKFWSKETGARPPYFRARCGKCGAGVKVVAGRPLANLPGHPSILRLRRILWCPGKPR